MNITRYTTGLILAGGAGRRVNGRDKGLLPWHGRPLIEHVSECIRPQVGRLLISCNRNIETYAALADATVCDTRRDFQGPLAGLEAAIPLLNSEFLLVSPCDAPLLPADLCARLLQSMDEADISYAHDGVRGQFLCAVLRRQVLPSLHAFLDSGHRSVHHWYEQHRHSVVDFSDQAQSFANFNRLDA